jgi:O-Antigen ligase
MSMRNSARLTLLLFYSLSPGFAKVSGIELLFGAGILSLCGYFLLVRPGPATAARDRTGGVFRYALLAVVPYIAVLAAWLLALGMVHDRLVAVGVFTFVAPLAIVTIAGPGRARQLLRDTPAIAAIHAVLALLIYPPLRPGFDAIESIGQVLMEGTAAFRLSSVSGSLAMSGFMVVAFSMAMKEWLEAPPASHAARLNLAGAALFLFCGFMSLQRAAWLALMLVISAALLALPNKRRLAVAWVILVAFAPLALGLASVDLPPEIVDLVIDRFGTITGGGDDSAVSERSGQWVNVFGNFLTQPFGYGPGQLGQAVRDAEPYSGGLPIYDGDYFRIVSEYGAGGILLILIVVVLALKAFRMISAARKGETTPGQVFIAGAALGLMLQAVGTNVTELYFTNALFWALLLQIAAWRRTVMRPLLPRTRRTAQTAARAVAAQSI